MAELSTQSVNDLDDSDFGYVEPGGVKDKSGKTVPRSLRHFPIHDACIIGSVEIPLLDGRQVPIRDLVGVDEFWVYSFDPETRAIVPGRGHSARMTMESQTVARVTLDSGETVTTTPDHRFMLRSGDYRMAQDLAPGDSLMPLYRKVVKMHDKLYERLWQPFYRYWELTHHAMDRFAHGPLLEGNVVHHRNENQFDNTPVNLEQMTRAAHLAHHGDINGEKHIARLQEGSRRRWERPGEREKQSEFRRQFNLRMIAEGRLPSKPMRDWCATRESAAAVHDRYMNGESLSGLAAELGVSVSGLKLGFRRYDLPSRKQAALLNNHKVVSVEFIDEPQPVYDLSVDTFHNFAIDAGVFVHNSHVRNALSRAPQSPFGDKAMPKIVSAAKKFGIDVGSDSGRSVAEVMGVDVERRYLGEHRKSAYLVDGFRLETRAAEDGTKHIAGYGAVFTRQSRNLGGFVEQCAPDTFSRAALEGYPGTVARYNHDQNLLLGTVQGRTLSLHTDNIGLHYDVRPPQSRGDIVELVERGDVAHSSFAFRVQPGGDEWGITDQNYPLRTLHDVELVDVAPVVTPAYPDSSAGLRSLALRFDAPEAEVRKMADSDELRKFFVRTDNRGLRPKAEVKRGLLGALAATDLMSRREDPWQDM